MQSLDAQSFLHGIENEKVGFDKYNLLTPVPRSSMTTAWVMKKESNGTLCGRLNVRGCAQVDGNHCVLDSINTPLTNPITLQLVLTLL